MATTFDDVRSYSARRKREHYLGVAIVCVALAASCCTASGQPPGLGRPPPNVELRNGLWFDGAGFEARTVYSVDGVFAMEPPERIDETLDLAGTFVVPPFAEAHNHDIGLGAEERDRQAIAAYLAAGVFYVKIQGNWPLGAEDQARLGLNRPDGLDVRFAHGSLTATGGHPTGLAAALLAQGQYPGQTLETMHDHYFFTIDSALELDAKWPSIAALEPDFIKTFLVFSEEFEKRRDDPAALKGIDPRVLPQIVAKAHASGLRVTTHTLTAADFRTAVRAGADEIAHVPLAFVPSVLGGPHDEALTAADAALAAEHGVTVVTTIRAWRDPLVRRGASPEEIAKVYEGLEQHLALLVAAGVPIVIGSDGIGDAADEAAAILATGIVEPAALLRTWTGETARAIFPERRIGSLEEGYEASFVALAGNPLEDWESVRRVRWRFKQGALLAP